MSKQSNFNVKRSEAADKLPKKELVKNCLKNIYKFKSMHVYYFYHHHEREIYKNLFDIYFLSKVNYHHNGEWLSPSDFVKWPS